MFCAGAGNAAPACIVGSLPYRTVRAWRYREQRDLRTLHLAALQRVCIPIARALRLHRCTIFPLAAPLTTARAAKHRQARCRPRCWLARATSPNSSCPSATLACLPAHFSHTPPQPPPPRLACRQTGQGLGWDGAAPAHATPPTHFPAPSCTRCRHKTRTRVTELILLSPGATALTRCRNGIWQRVLTRRWRGEKPLGGRRGGPPPACRLASGAALCERRCHDGGDVSLGWTRLGDTATYLPLLLHHRRRMARARADGPSTATG